jgi:hypothetical protein
MHVNGGCEGCTRAHLTQSCQCLSVFLSASQLISHAWRGSAKPHSLLCSLHKMERMMQRRLRVLVSQKAKFSLRMQLP